MKDIVSLCEKFPYDLMISIERSCNIAYHTAVIFLRVGNRKVICRKKDGVIRTRHYGLKDLVQGSTHFIGLKKVNYSKHQAMGYHRVGWSDLLINYFPPKLPRFCSFLLPFLKPSIFRSNAVVPHPHPQNWSCAQR